MNTKQSYRKINLDEELDFLEKTSKSVVDPSNITMYQLHKYLNDVLSTSYHNFDQVVGYYDSESIDISGITLSKGDALAQMLVFCNVKGLAGSPFSKLVRTNAEVFVSPVGYVVTTKTGETKTVPMNGGVPATEPPVEIKLHKALTAVLATGVPEYKKDAKTGQSVMVKPVAPSGVLYPRICVPHSLKVVAEEYNGGTSLVNIRSKLMDYVIKEKKAFQMSCIFATAHKQAIDVVKKKKWDKNWDPMDCVKPITNEKYLEICNAPLKKGGKPIPSFEFTPVSSLGNVSVESLEQAYDFQQRCRETRGSDNGKISPLTNGVYYGELDTFYRGVTAAADIIQIAKICSCRLIDYSGHSFFKPAWPILEMNQPILKGLSGNLWKEEKFGVFRNTYETETPYGKPVLKLDCVSSNAPTRGASGWQWTPHIPAMEQIIDGVLSGYKHIAVSVYSYPGMFEKYGGRIWPSLHAHSGRVWITNVSKSKYTLRDHMDRMCKANVMKTFYPFMFKTFQKGDMCVWPQVCVKRAKRKAITIEFKILYNSDDLEEEIIIDDDTLEQMQIAQADIAMKYEQEQIEQGAFNLNDLIDQEMGQGQGESENEDEEEPEAEEEDDADAQINALDLYG